MLRHCFHSVIKFGRLLPAAPAIIIGFAFAVAAVQQHPGSSHFNDDHKVRLRHPLLIGSRLTIYAQKLGLVICILYVVQCTLGAVVHFIKNPNRVRRPAQNYVHAVLGLVIIALAFAQVRSGYHSEWSAATGRGNVSNGVNIVWIIWVVVRRAPISCASPADTRQLLPVLYFGGLAFLPRQFRMEREAREQREVGQYADKLAAQRSRSYPRPSSSGPYGSRAHADSAMALSPLTRGRMSFEHDA